MSDTLQIDENEAKKLVGTYAVQQYRWWSNEHRFIHKIAAPYSLPPINSGRRYTKFLTASGARKLAESCEYVSIKKGGFTTFLTLTFDKDARERLQKGGTVQKELSRFFDGLQKMYKRGFIFKNDLFEEKIKGKSGGLNYLWVAENPDSYVDFETGEMVTNPHVHVLMRWNVEYKYFKKWAERVENLWGQGFAHLEKLRSKKRESAAAYLMKALKYLSKSSSESEQGVIYGNRYGISKPARADGWENVKVFAWGKLGKLIEHARMIQNRKRKPIEEKRDYLKKQLEKSVTKSQENKIQNKLNKVRDELAKVKGSIFYGRNRVVCDSGNSANKFIDYIKNNGFEWFDKPLSIYSEILRKKQKIIDDYHRKWELYNNEFYEKSIWWKSFKGGGADKFAWF